MSYLFTLVAFPILFKSREGFTVVQRQHVILALSHLFAESIKHISVYLLILEASEKNFLVADFMKREDNKKFLGVIMVSRKD